MGDLREQMRRGRREAPSPDEAMDRLTERRERRERNGRVLSAVVALAVTGGLVAGGLAVLNHRGTATGPGGGGSQTNTGPATSGSGGASGPATSGAAAGANLAAGPGQFYYWKFAMVIDGQPATMTYWWSPDGTGRVLGTSSAHYSAVPDGPLHVGATPIGDDLSNLSTDPAQLLPELVQRSSDEGASPRPDITPGPGQDAETGRLVSAVQDLLGEMAPHSTPALRIALYQVLKQIPTVQDLGTMQDPTGRNAVALRVMFDGSLTTFWFDPDTHLFLAEEEAAGVPAAAPTLSGTSTPGDTSPMYVIVQSGGIVGSDTAVPTGDQRIVPEAGPLPTS